MISSKEIRNVTFSNSVGGYRKEEVDILLDKIEVDLDQYEKLVAALTEQNEQLKKDIEGYKSSQDSIQNVLLSAQKLADQIVAEANEKSKAIVDDAENSIVDITEKSKRIAEEFDERATEKKQKLQEELDRINEEAQTKRALIEHAAAESVKEQQAVFDNLKTQIAAFKADVIAKYKQHLELLNSLPECAENDPKGAVSALKDDMEKISNIRSQSSVIESNESDEDSDSSEDIKSDSTAPTDDVQDGGFITLGEDQ